MKRIFIAVFLITLSIWGACAFHSGVTISPDSHAYDEWSEILIAKNFNVIAYHRSIEFSVPPYLYMGFVSLVALVKIFAGKFWPHAIVMINVILGAFSALMLADLVYSFTKNKLAVWVAAGLYIVNPEIILWSRYVLSDSSYMFLNLLIFYLTAKLFLRTGKAKFKTIAIIILLLLFSCFYRPTGLIMVPPVSFALYLRLRKKAMRWGAFFAYFTVLVLASIIVHAMVVKDTDLWPLEFGGSYLKGYVVDSYREGVVVYSRPHTYHQTPVGLMDYILITVDKFVSYFYFSDRMFSFAHNLINYFVFAPLYVLFVLGVVDTAKRAVDPCKRSLIALCIVMITAYALCYAMTLTDFDWRYRLPIMPYILLVSGAGFDVLLDRLRLKER